MLDAHRDHKPMSVVMIMMSSKNPIKVGLSFSSAFFFFSLFIICFSLSHVPPSTLFNDTKFWFLLSNAIILVVAADSGAFSSSSDNKIMKHDVTNNRVLARQPSPSLVSLDSHDDEHKVGKELALISSTSTISTSHDSEQPIKENDHALVLVIGDDHEHCRDIHDQDRVPMPSNDGGDEGKAIISSRANLRRSNTEKLEPAPMEYLESCEVDMSNIVPTSDDHHPESRSLRRSKTENLENKGSEESEGCDEFSAMSVEELLSL